MTDSPNYKKVDAWECNRCGMLVASRDAHNKWHNRAKDFYGEKVVPLTKEAHTNSGEQRMRMSDAMTRTNTNVRLRSDGEWPV